MADVPKTHHVHCDESQTTGQRFMVYGGIITSAGNVAAFDEVMTKWRADHNMHSELKWTKVSNQKFAEYKSLVDLIFEHVSAQQLHFKSVVFDTHQIDYAHHKGNKELGF